MVSAHEENRYSLCAWFLEHFVNSPMAQESVLAQGGVFVGEQVFTDVYWDTEGCGLTERNWWLRTRAGRWELKASIVVRFRNLKPEEK